MPPSASASAYSVRRTLSQVTVEPVIFFGLFAVGLDSIISQNLLIERVCRVDLDLPESVCAALDAHPDDQVEVQRRVNLISTAKNVLSCIPGVAICLFVGPWSDANGRKPLLVMPLLGSLVSYVFLMVYVFVRDMGGMWYLATAVYAFIGGGFIVLLTGAFSYITDITRSGSRTSRIAYVDFGLFFGFPLGSLVSGVLFQKVGYYGVFGTSVVILALCLVYVVFRIEETILPRDGASAAAARQQEEEEGGDGESTAPAAEDLPKRLLHWSHVASVFVTCFRRRPNNNRAVILVLVACMLLNVSAFNNSSISYLYTRLKFDWTEKSYSIWMFVTSGMSAAGSVVILPLLSSRAGFHDATLGMMGSASATAAQLGIAFAFAWQWMFFCSFMGIMGGFATVIIRSSLSKICSQDEIGKIFSLLACLESAFPIVTSPLLTLIYNSTLEVFPGASYCYLAALNVLTGTLMLWVRVMTAGQRQHGSYGVIQEDEEGPPEEAGGREEEEEERASESVQT